VRGVLPKPPSRYDSIVLSPSWFSLITLITYQQLLRIGSCCAATGCLADRTISLCEMRSRLVFSSDRARREQRAEQVSRRAHSGTTAALYMSRTVANSVATGANNSEGLTRPTSVATRHNDACSSRARNPRRSRSARRRAGIPRRKCCGGRCLSIYTVSAAMRQAPFLRGPAITARCRAPPFGWRRSGHRRPRF
jgi:hypothetical protein